MGGHEGQGGFGVVGKAVGGTTTGGTKNIDLYDHVMINSTYDVAITPGGNMKKTTNSGSEYQAGIYTRLNDVIYTADEGYYFPENYSVPTVNGISVSRDSATQITVSGIPTSNVTMTLTAATPKPKPDAPTTPSATDCTTAANNDGKLTGVTTAMEYKKSDSATWTSGTGSDITDLTPGIYYVRVKATDSTNASDNQELTIKGVISATVIFKVVNGFWDEGEDDAATADKTVVLTGMEGDTLKLSADQIPAVGSKPKDTYKSGSWNVIPSTETAITEATTYIYTYAKKEMSVVNVTFKVVNGSWDDGTSTEKTFTLTGSMGEILKLTSDQIPEVGSKPDDSYRAGSWDVTPSTETAITQDTTYIYSYELKPDKQQQVIAAEDVTATVGDTDKKVTGSITTPETGGGAISYSVKKGSGDYIDVDASTGALTIKAVPAEGKAFVTVKAAETEDYLETTKDITVTISEVPQPVVTPSVTLDKTALSLTVNEEKTLIATVVPEGTAVTWTTSNEAIATVDGNGTIKAITAGDAVITAAITVGEVEYKGTCAVTVTAKKAPSAGIVETKALSDDNLSPGIIARYGSAAQVILRLQEIAGMTYGGWENYIVFDARVMVVTDEGERPATVYDIPPEGLEAIFRYPNSTNKDDFIFSGAHMMGETYGEYQAGDVELLAFSNENDGLHTRIHGLSPVIITWARKDASAKSGDPIDRHVHVYEWDTINATADQDGEMRYQCRICGDIKTRVPITAYYIFNKETTEKIRKAKQGETVKIETARWISFHKMVMEALAERPDVTLEVSFLDEGHKGARKSFTIPAGTTGLTSLVDEKGFAGFIYLSNIFVKEN